MIQKKTDDEKKRWSKKIKLSGNHHNRYFMLFFSWFYCDFKRKGMFFFNFYSNE